MKQYLEHLDNLLYNGNKKEDRTGTGTLSLFGHQMRFDLREKFPLFTGKATHFPSIAHELLWFICGDTNVRYLQDNGVKIWDEWATPGGELGPVYGEQWRSWRSCNKWGDMEHTDQLQDAINTLKAKPEDRGIIVSAWNVGDLYDMALRPCHTMFQFYTHELTFEERKQWVIDNLDIDNTLSPSKEGWEQFFSLYGTPKHYLSCNLYQRSADWFLGVPFNIASYSLLTHMVARITNMIPYEFVHSFGDTHLYTNHVDQAKELLSRKDSIPELPTIEIAYKENIDDYTFDDFTLINYNPLPAIKAPVAV